MRVLKILRFGLKKVSLVFNRKTRHETEQFSKMSVNKIVTVVGARPQFVKAAAVSKAIEKFPEYREVLVHTGQHYDKCMSDSFFDELDMHSPSYNLGVGSGSHGFQTAEIMKLLETVLIDEKPEMVLVYGDTNSTLSAAVTASKLHIPIAHIEAGLRSFNREMPEEINRVVADHISTLLFCPTRTAVQNLEGEGITKNVFKTGDVMYDVTLQFTPKAQEKSRILRALRLHEKEYILATVHRAENTDHRERLLNIFSALNELAREMAVVIPLHPRTRKMLHSFGYEDHLQGLVVIEPVGFLDMLSLESNAKLIATDSGGIQKEAYFQQVPCVTMRDETEWVETVEARWNKLADVDSAADILTAVRTSLTVSAERLPICEYGDGRASEKMVSAIESYLNEPRKVTD